MGGNAAPASAPQPLQPVAETLTVVCRFRPPYKRSLPLPPDARSLYGFPEGGRSVTITADSWDVKQFTFDRVYSSEHGQADIAETVVARVMNAVVDGYNGTILACKYIFIITLGKEMLAKSF